MPKHVLPDVLGPNLKILFCGSAAGTASAIARAYYAKPGNKFWPILAKSGLTPVLLQPPDYLRVLEFGIGLTDMCKTEYGQDDALSGAGDDTKAVRRKVRRYKPRVLAFVGKRSASVFLGRKVEYGLQEARIDDTAIFVLPSTSGRAGSFWTEEPWHALSAFVKALPGR
jgi:double-stranded uracil-DNA glycosylase